MTDQESTDRLLRRNRRALERGAPAGACLDAETIAAWSDGSLPSAERSAAEAHAADCPRCLHVIAALARTEPEPVPVPSWAGWLRSRWLVPLTAAATAALLWVMVEQPGDRRILSGPPPEQAAAKLEPAPAVAVPEPAAPAVPVPGDAPTQPAPAPAAAPESRRAPAVDAAPVQPVPPEGLATLSRPSPPLPAEAQERARAAERGELAESITSQAPAGEPAADAAAPVIGLTRNVAERPPDIVSPDPAVRWRLAGTAMERTVDGGRTWIRQDTGAGAALLAGAAPSPTVCWVAGASGTILRSTDGETWTRLPFPEPVDLVAVTATDAERAAVTTVDGRSFRSADGGRTWVLQETPAAPF